jgi:hypothetical protein
MDHGPNGVTVDARRTVTLNWTFTHPRRLQHASREPDHHATGTFGRLTAHD